MNPESIGGLIRRIRREKGMTQLQLAEKLHISDRTISKWERGAGCPDISLLPPLCQALDIPTDTLLSGGLPPISKEAGHMKKTKFFVCPQCGNILTAAGDARIICCGMALSPLEAKKPEGQEDLIIEQVEDEYYITSPHEMTKNHFITFLAHLTGERLILLRQYPEWDLGARLPRRGRGMLYWYCSRHGLFRKLCE
ncbi:MAG: helix-turn-helix domain-containing protein [Clostridia bacterium]|nr:helix-turn-helix domain-containing protein [Clostridia bacterium]